MKLRALLLFTFLAGGAACGSSTPPTHQLTETQASIRGAEEAGAADTPKAALHLKMARDHLQNAQTLINNEEYDDASLVLKRAEADAELSIALAKQAKAQADADQEQQKVQQLKRDQGEP